MSNYQGLGSYSRERVDPFEQRAGESDEAHRRRRNQFWRGSEELADESEAWAEHRARVDAPVGQGAGLFGRASATDRGAALGSPMGGGEQRPERLGGIVSTAVPGSRVVPLVYADEINEDRPRVSPLTEYLRSSGEGIFVR